MSTSDFGKGEKYTFSLAFSVQSMLTLRLALVNFSRISVRLSSLVVKGPSVNLLLNMWVWRSIRSARLSFSFDEVFWEKRVELRKKP